MDFGNSDFKWLDDKLTNTYGMKRIGDIEFEINEKSKRTDWASQAKAVYQFDSTFLIYSIYQIPARYFEAMKEVLGWPDENSDTYGFDNNAEFGFCIHKDIIYYFICKQFNPVVNETVMFLQSMYQCLQSIQELIDEHPIIPEEIVNDLFSDDVLKLVTKGFITDYAQTYSVKRLDGLVGEIRIYKAEVSDFWHGWDDQDVKTGKEIAFFRKSELGDKKYINIIVYNPEQEIKAIPLMPLVYDGINDGISVRPVYSNLFAAARF